MQTIDFVILVIYAVAIFGLAGVKPPAGFQRRVV